LALTRRAIPTEPGLANVGVRIADYGDPAALAAALEDVDTLVFVSSDGPTAQVVVHHQNVIRAAAASGVGHIVALSGLDADPGSPFCYAVSYAYTERLLLEAGCSVSIARASIFTEFFLEFLLPARITGEIRVAAADARISLVSRFDVGRCLAALAVAAPTNRHHEITGPQPLDLPAIAASAAEAWDRPVKYLELTPTEFRVELARSGEEPWWEYAYSTMFDSVVEDRWSAVSDEVVRLTGRSPTPLREVLRACAPAGTG
jgi:NAD(P)H dehydrogenase (quinone)